MINAIVRFVKRFLVLVPGIAITIWSIQGIFPALDEFVYKPVAILLTYVIAAYVLIPALIRIYRVFFPARHLPHYSVTPDGFASDPVNVAIVGTRRQLLSAMDAAGWYLADSHSIRNIIRLVIATITGQKYPNAPMSSLYLLGRRQDLGFEIPLEDRGHRHHVRFWATTFDANKPISAQTIHWQAKRHVAPTEEVVWLGAASRDTGIQLIRHNAQFTHMIHPDTNRERELIVSGLSKTKWFATLSRIELTPSPYRLANRVWRGYLEADGELAICYLKNPKPKRLFGKKPRAA